MTTALTVWGIGFALLFFVGTDGPPYPSRDSLIWMFIGTVLWPLLLVAVPLLLLYLHLTEEK